MRKERGNLPNETIDPNIFYVDSVFDNLKYNARNTNPTTNT